jgi:putative redox protein
MVDIHARYEGDLHCTAQHGPSATQLSTDAPLDNQGRGATFSPTDLVATALGTCMLTTMGIAARRGGWNVEGLELNVKKLMTTQPPRRIERLPVEVRVPKTVGQQLDGAAKRALEHAARTCPVALSLSAGIAIDVSFDW